MEDSNSRKGEGEITTPLSSPIHTQTEHNVHGMEYFHWPAWLPAWTCSLLPPAHPLTSQTRETGKQISIVSDN